MIQPAFPPPPLARNCPPSRFANSPGYFNDVCLIGINCIGVMQAHLGSLATTISSNNLALCAHGCNPAGIVYIGLSRISSLKRIEDALNALFIEMMERGCLRRSMEAALLCGKKVASTKSNLLNAQFLDPYTVRERMDHNTDSPLSIVMKNHKIYFSEYVIFPKNAEEYGRNIAEKIHQPGRVKKKTLNMCVEASLRTSRYYEKHKMNLAPIVSKRLRADEEACKTYINVIAENIASERLMQTDDVSYDGDCSDVKAQPRAPHRVDV